MEKLTVEQLFGLEQYARRRHEFRAQVMAHRDRRRVAVGPNMAWCFEDRLTIQYQVQELLRAARVFEPQRIQDELEVCNPLIPDGTNWKATLLVEFPDSAQRHRQLALLRGVERRCWVRVSGFEQVFAIPALHSPREHEAQTATVHSLRFELGRPLIAALRAGAELDAGADHEHYRYAVEPVAERTRASLLGDLA